MSADIIPFPSSDGSSDRGVRVRIGGQVFRIEVLVSGDTDNTPAPVVEITKNS